MPRPDSARTSGGRDVRAVQPNRDAVPARATAFGTAPAPRAPRAQADAHPHRTLATRAEPKPPPPGRPQSATGAPCGARPHPSSPAQPSPLRRRVRAWRLTTLTNRGYRQQQTRALRSLLVEGQHDEALAALLPSTRSPARRGTRGDRYVVRPAGAWSCSRPLSMEDGAQTAEVSGRCRRQPRAGRPADCREMILRRRRPTLNPPEEAA